MTARRQIREAPPRAPQEAADPLIGATIAGKYNVVRLLARGGVGLVYLARQAMPEGGEREVVVKVLAPHWIENPEARARFEREGQRLGGLQHANIVALHDCGHEHGVAYLVMEYLVGELLSDHLARKGRLTMEEFVPIAAQILKGLGYAHSRGLMHRDIKPSNIMLTVRKGRANFVKILDFGMAKLVEGEQNVTAEQIVGTANYMAPEQVQGEALDVRVDVYALGVLFYAMLGGRMPFEGENNAALLYKHVHEEAPPLTSFLPEGHGIPDELIALVHQCLAKDPEARPPDADAMVEALIDCCPASMFHLPVADGSVGVFMSAASGADQSMFDLSRPPPRRARTREGLARPRTQNSLSRPKTARDMPPAQSVSSSSPSFGSTIIALEATQQPRGWGFVASAAAALLAGGLVAALVWGRGDAVEPVAGNAGVGDERRLAALLDQVEAEVLAGEFDKARRHLDGAARDIEVHPALKARSDASRTRIAVASTLEHAQRLEKDGKVPAAMSAYKDILAIDPHHAEARAALARLTEELSPGSPTPSAVVEAASVGKTGAGKTARSGGGGKTDRGDNSTSVPGETAEGPKSAPATEAQDDPFLPVGKKGGGGIFLPVGGSE